MLPYLWLEQKVFRYSDYRFIVIPISLLGINLSYFLHENIMEYFYWILEIWTYYAMPFQVILPIIIWIVVKIKMAMKNPVGFF